MIPRRVWVIRVMVASTHMTNVTDAPGEMRCHDFPTFCTRVSPANDQPPALGRTCLVKAHRAGGTRGKKNLCTLANVDNTRHLGLP